MSQGKKLYLIKSNEKYASKDIGIVEKIYKYLQWIIFQFHHQMLLTMQDQFPVRIVQSLDHIRVACDLRVHECNLCNKKKEKQ